MIYHVVMSSVEYYGIDIEADSPEEAEEIAYETDGADFVFEDNTDWEIDSITESSGKRIFSRR